jgi:peroxiredoxin
MQRYFPIPFVMLLSISSLIAIIQIITLHPFLSWLGVVLTSLPMLSFFIWISVSDVTRSSRYLILQLFTMISGLALCMVFYISFMQLLLSILASLGTIYYIFIYTSLDRSNGKVTLNDPLAIFSLNNLDGKQVSSQVNHQRYRLWLFIRANWCPLCVAQVKELAGQYQALESLGCDVYIISSQAEKESQQLAKKLQVPLQFLIDADNKVAKLLGIEHINGTPFGMQGFEADTAMPTAIISAPDNEVIFFDQTDDYRLRPEPSVFIEVIKSHKN